MNVRLLTDEGASVPHDFGNQRAPTVGEYVTIENTDPEGLPDGTWRVTRVSWALVCDSGGCSAYPGSSSDAGTTVRARRPVRPARHPAP
jgi:hypothetical protein